MEETAAESSEDDVVAPSQVTARERAGSPGALGWSPRPGSCLLHHSGQESGSPLFRGLGQGPVCKALHVAQPADHGQAASLSS